MNLNNLIFLALQAAEQREQDVEEYPEENRHAEIARIKADAEELREFSQRRMSKLDNRLTLDDLLPEEEPILTQKEPGEPDFVLHAGSCWIEVNDPALYIVKLDNGVSVDVTPVDDADTTLDNLIVEL